MTVPPTAEGDVVQVVAFRVGPYEFAADVFTVRRVVRYEAPARAREAPPFTEGWVRVGDRDVAVLDLRKRFAVGGGGAGAGDGTRIVVVEGEAGPVGLVVDEAREVLKVPAGAVEPPPPRVHGLDAGYVQGIIRLPDRSLVLLRIQRLLTSTERIALEPDREKTHG